MFNNIIADIKRFQHIEEISLLRLFLSSPGFQTLMIYRFGRWLRSIRRNPLNWLLILFLTPVCWCLNAYIRFESDIIIDQSSEIGPGLYIGHFGGIWVHNCQIGAHCSIHQQVHLEPILGNNDGPIIGNRVWIGAHARIQGSIQVGDGVTIGAGALVTQDVDAGWLILGNPSRLFQRNYDNSSIL